MKQRWDIFCAVVDNYGDIGFCWRLARLLAFEHGITVRLWVDDPVSLARLHPAADPALSVQQLEGIEIRTWITPMPAVDVAHVVIEAFACELPESYLRAMAALPSPPVWINLEYLSAEDWVAGCHGLASPHPRLPLTRHFFFPGFFAGTGGLLREHDYDLRRHAFNPDAFRQALNLPPARPGEATISLFGYENTALPSLLQAWSAEATPIRVLLPESRLTPAVQAFFGDSPWQRNALTVHRIPFLPQTGYDELLWISDLNFVRGEESFVRAQWAARPLVWHIYPQAGNYHRIKLAAFLRHYAAGLEDAAATALATFWHAWEAGRSADLAWPAFRDALPTLNRHAGYWAEKLATGGDLAGNLVAFASGSR
ncbi:MAG: elongation factor P maturation arginine rhamnosyltransferase EarP [Proteobacteria bacterium]|nr:elongation factor P maturation arginine rhamnosyltransferase EarP [Pseudomonadota bacterium]HQR02593.1 elongation factor P maturation arginine rhamnosyltransferase EarP [Rhodocyclaceae bacterium]